jgi:hypothetical protein
MSCNEGIVVSVPWEWLLSADIKSETKIGISSQAEKEFTNFILSHLYRRSDSIKTTSATLHI